MSVLAGPFLRFVRCTEAEWVVSAVVVADGAQPPSLSWSVASSNVANSPPKPRNLLRNGTSVVWRYEWAVPVQANEQTIEYTIEKQVRRYFDSLKGEAATP